MNKVKLTNDQAKAIEKLKGGEFYNNAYPVEYKVKNSFEGKLEALNSLTTDEFIRALYIGYEVEPEFKVGDWVVNHYGTLGKIKNINEFGEYEGFWLRTFENVPMCCRKDAFVRHVTPEEVEKEKQRIWWAKHGREVWELKEGDVLIGKPLGHLEKVRSVVGEYVWFSKYDKVPKNVVKEVYKVVCFAEQRLDKGDKQC